MTPTGIALQKIREEIVEECAQKLEWLMDQEDIDVSKWPEAIRALKGIE